MNPLTRLSVIIPVAQGDTSWIQLLPDLKNLPQSSEVLLVGPPPHQNWMDFFGSEKAFQPTLKWIESPQGRAIQLNRGAASTKSLFLWFLHADSRVPPKALSALALSLRKNPNALHYFDLKFSEKNPRLMFLNHWGVWLRSHFLGIPFGDQGFCISKEGFEKSGRFLQEAPLGEDHLFLWSSKQAGIKLKCTSAFIYTSARKYQTEGWLKTTLTHLYTTLTQAMPEWIKFIKEHGI